MTVELKHQLQRSDTVEQFIEVTIKSGKYKGVEGFVQVGDKVRSGKLPVQFKDSNLSYAYIPVELIAVKEVVEPNNPKTYTKGSIDNTRFVLFVLSTGSRCKIEYMKWVSDLITEFYGRDNPVPCHSDFNERIKLHLGNW